MNREAHAALARAVLAKGKYLSQDRPRLTIWCACAPTQNARIHWAVRNRANVKIKESVLFQTRGIEGRELRQNLKSCVKRYVRVTRFWGGRSKELDAHDNLRSAAKPAIDALTIKHGGWILVDDSPAWLDADYGQEKTKDRTIQGTLRLDIY